MCACGRHAARGMQMRVPGLTRLARLTRRTRLTRRRGQICGRAAGQIGAGRSDWSGEVRWGRRGQISAARRGGRTVCRGLRCGRQRARVLAWRPDWSVASNPQPWRVGGGPAAADDQRRRISAGAKAAPAIGGSAQQVSAPCCISGKTAAPAAQAERPRMSTGRCRPTGARRMACGEIRARHRRVPAGLRHTAAACNARLTISALQLKTDACG